MSKMAGVCKSFRYMGGFGNTFASESVPHSLPQLQNSPQRVAGGLYAEQLNGTAFTMARRLNGWVWQYRIRPSVMHGASSYRIAAIHELPPPSGRHHAMHALWQRNDARARLSAWLPPARLTSLPMPPKPRRWNPLPPPPEGERIDFVDGIVTVAAHGSPAEHSGCMVSTYTATASMSNTDAANGQPNCNRVLVNSDAEMLILPQRGTLLIRTELGILTVEPLELAVVPRGIKFQVDLMPDSEDSAGSSSCASASPSSPGSGSSSLPSASTYYRGYLCENYGQPLGLPELGPIGSSTGLANPRHFKVPVAAYSHEKAGNDVGHSQPRELLWRQDGNTWAGPIKYSPFDVVAWYGNYVPYKYDLRLFTVINSVTHDHPDPSIYTVLTSPSSIPGTANLDFVIFPPRWVVGENTFRPPWFHRNFMSECMGLLKGTYDAKADGFLPGGWSVHNSMVAHGPDQPSWKKASEEDTKTPTRYDGTMAFMFESHRLWHSSPLVAPFEDVDYLKTSWDDMPCHFDPSLCSQETAERLPFDGALH
eukprot:GHVT01063887.1.p1 GENE.GHVT01063887.1~~GHVT01063887.1.p1  ORF type:complete len:536 (-),score=94.47 GHVT01063887.1:1089-2696(-)